MCSRDDDAARATWLRADPDGSNAAAGLRDADAAIGLGVVVVESEDVLLPAGGGTAGHRSRGGAARVVALRLLGRSRVELGVIRRFVEAHSPDYDGRVTAVTEHHLADVLWSCRIS